MLRAGRSALQTPLPKTPNQVKCLAERQKAKKSPESSPLESVSPVFNDDVAFSFCIRFFAHRAVQNHVRRCT